MSYVKQDDSGGGGDTYNLLANQDGNDVDLVLDAAASPDSQVKFKAGTNITLTEAGTNSISIDATGGGSPGGANSQIQYNDGGSFGGDAAFTFDDTAGAKQVVIEGSSTADLVRITQTGSGDALVVEDSANPDNTPVRVSDRGDLIAGTVSNFLGKLRVSGSSGNRNITDPSGQANIIARLDSTASAIELLNFPPESGNLLVYQPYVDGEFTFIRRDGTTNNLETSMVLSTEDTIKIGLGGKNYGTAGQVLTSGGPNGAVSWTTVSGGGASFAPVASVFRKPSTNNVRTSLTAIAPYGQGSQFQNTNVPTDPERIHWLPFIAPETVTITKLSVYVSSATAGSPNISLGIYDDTIFGSGTTLQRIPGNLQMTASVSTTSSGYNDGTVSAASGGSTTITQGKIYYAAYAPAAAPVTSGSQVQGLASFNRHVIGISIGNAAQIAIRNNTDYSYGDAFALSYPTTYQANSNIIGTTGLHLMYRVD